jgi:hypothetical protein
MSAEKVSQVIQVSDDGFRKKKEVDVGEVDQEVMSGFDDLVNAAP